MGCIFAMILGKSYGFYYKYRIMCGLRSAFLIISMPFLTKDLISAPAVSPKAACVSAKHSEGATADCG